MSEENLAFPVCFKFFCKPFILHFDITLTLVVLALDHRFLTGGPWTPKWSVERGKMEIGN